MAMQPPPIPSFLDPITLPIPGLPQALEGFSILHVSDTHVRHPRKRHEEIFAAVEGCAYDLLAITGDLMVEPGDEPAAAEMVAHLVRIAKPRLGIAGVWGNHDTLDLRPRLAALPVRWLDNSAWCPPSLPLTVLGVDCIRKEHLRPRGDLAAALLRSTSSPSWGEAGRGAGFRLLLAHMPTWLPPAAAAGVDLMLCGHTHAGQLRLPTGHVLYNATPRWPTRFSSGLLQLGTTQCLISRGLGEVYVPGLRFFCKPQMPLITLRRAEALKPVAAVTQVKKW